MILTVRKYIAKYPCIDCLYFVGCKLMVKGKEKLGVPLPPVPILLIGNVRNDETLVPGGMRNNYRLKAKLFFSRRGRVLFSAVRQNI